MMDINYFKAIHGAVGTSHWKDKQVARIQRGVNKYFHKSSDYQYDTMRNGIPQELIIYDGTMLNKKKVITRPSEEIHIGDIIDAYGAKWFVTDVDLNQEIYTVADIILCNCIIRWISRRSGEIIERFGYAENAAKYATGVRDSNVYQEIEFQIKVKLTVDEETVLLRRDDRFLLDLDFYIPVINTKGDHPTAFMLTSTDTVTRRENIIGAPDKGAIEFIFAECAYDEQSDNPELMIADYYKMKKQVPEKSLGKCEIAYKGEPEVRFGGKGKTFTAVFYDNSGNAVSIPPVWDIIADSNVMSKISTSEIDNNIVITVDDDPKLYGRIFRLRVFDNASAPSYVCEIPIRIRGVITGG